jgi:hypothetical protein
MKGVVAMRIGADGIVDRSGRERSLMSQRI